MIPINNSMTCCHVNNGTQGELPLNNACSTNLANSYLCKNHVNINQWKMSILNNISYLYEALQIQVG